MREQETESPQQMVACRSIYGNTVMIPRTQLTFRPAVYGLVVHEGTILLVRSRNNGKYALPGGGVEVGERMDVSLKREIREETGCEVEVQQCVHFQEDFFYYDPLDRARHSFLFYYQCRPISTELLDDDLVDDDDAEQPRWIDIQYLGSDDFQHHGETILRLAVSHASFSKDSTFRSIARRT